MSLSKNLFFATAGATTIFIVTILAMVAMLVGDQNAPANLWFNANGAVVLTVEVVAIGVLGMAAMIADRYETLRELEEKARRKEQVISGDGETLNQQKRS